MTEDGKFKVLVLSDHALSTSGVGALINSALGNDLEVDRENSGIDPDIEIIKVKEIREDTKTGKKSATVEVKAKGKGDATMEMEVILKQMGLLNDKYLVR